MRTTATLQASCHASGGCRQRRGNSHEPVQVVPPIQGGVESTLGSGSCCGLAAQQAAPSPIVVFPYPPSKDEDARAQTSQDINCLRDSGTTQPQRAKRPKWGDQYSDQDGRATTTDEQENIQDVPDAQIKDDISGRQLHKERYEDRDAGAVKDDNAQYEMRNASHQVPTVTDDTNIHNANEGSALFRNKIAQVDAFHAAVKANLQAQLARASGLAGGNEVYQEAINGIKSSLGTILDVRIGVG